jgi:putative endonuclease
MARRQPGPSTGTNGKLVALVKGRKPACVHKSLTLWRNHREMKGGWVYIMTNRNDGTLYVGVTNDIARRVWEHRQGGGSVFTSRYKLYRLVLMERYEEIETAIHREKRLKHLPRWVKVELIEEQNPGWADLSAEFGI